MLAVHSDPGGQVLCGLLTIRIAKIARKQIMADPVNSNKVDLRLRYIAGEFAYLRIA